MTNRMPTALRIAQLNFILYWMCGEQVEGCDTAFPQGTKTYSKIPCRVALTAHLLRQRLEPRMLDARHHIVRDGSPISRAGPGLYGPFLGRSDLLKRRSRRQPGIDSQLPEG